MRFTAKLAALVVLSLLIALVLSSAVYGATKSDTDSVNVNATVDNFISISHPADLNLGVINGTGGSVVGSATWTVVTNNDLGYTLQASASGAPAMTKGTDSFADYSQTPAPWAVAATDSAFGFSWDAGVNYRGFNGAAPITVHTMNNETAGDNTTLNFKAEVGANHLQASGSYTASVTITATTL